MPGAFRRRDEPLPQLPEKPLALNANFFREVVRRIESIVPIRGELINIEKPSNGSGGLKISLNASTIDLSPVTLNVCSNGVPSTITVLNATTQETSIKVFAEKQAGST